MIRFIYKIIHFEGSPDHKENVMKSFLFIWIFASITQFVLLYLIYISIAERNKILDYALLFFVIFTFAIFYYLIRIRLVKIFLDRGLDNDFYDFGKSNGILKPVSVIVIIGLIVLIGRIALSILT